MYKLYTKRLVNKDAFKEHTGIKVKAMPKPHKTVHKPSIILVGGKKPEEKAGYTIKTAYHPTTGAPTYYLVKNETAKSMDDEGVGLQDKTGKVKTWPELYLDLTIDGYKDADAAERFTLLQNQDNKDAFVKEFGKGAYYTQQYDSIWKMYGPLSGMKGMESVETLINFVDNAANYIDKNGEKQFYQELSPLIDAAYVNLEEAIGYDQQGGISLDLVRSIPAASDIELYYDENSLKDQIHLAKNEAPEGMNYPALLGSLRMPSYLL